MALRRKIKLNEAFFQGEIWIPAAELVKKYQKPTASDAHRKELFKARCNWLARRCRNEGPLPCAAYR